MLYYIAGPYSNDALHTACQEIESNNSAYVRARSSELWKIIKNLQNERKEKVNIIQIKPTNWEDYCYQRNTRKAFLEYSKTVKSLINPDLVKDGKEKLFRISTTIFNKIINAEAPLRECKTAHMTSTLANGDRGKCENFRGIGVRW